MTRKATTRASQYQRLCIASCVLAVGLAVASTSVAAPEASRVIELRDGLLIDPDAARVYVMPTKGGIAALDVASGRTLWRSGAAQRPVAAGQDKLLALRQPDAKGELALQLLAAHDGREIKPLQVPVAAGVHATVVDTMNHRFSLHAEDGVGADQLVWRHTYRPVRGVASLDDSAAPVNTAGVVALDFSQDEVTPSASKAPAARQVNRLAVTSAVAGDGRRFYAQDRRHILLSERNTGGSRAERYVWQIFDLDGKRIGRFDAPLSFTPFAVIERTLLLVTPARAQRVNGELLHEPLTLRAIDLDSATESWSAAVRDTHYHGPFPP